MATDSTTSNGNRFRGVLPKLILAAGGLALGLVAAELTLRIAGPSFPRMAIPDDRVGARLQPGMRGVWTKEGRASFTINSAGFRDVERQLAKPKDVYRIAVLGDSFIEALQVERADSVCALLQKQLNRPSPLTGHRVEVLSFGVSGYGTAQQLLAFDEHVKQYDPDLVVLAFFPGNDIADNSRALASYRVKPFFEWDGEELVPDDSFLQDADFLKSKLPSTHRKVALINSSRLLQLALEMRDALRRPASAEPTGPTVDDIAYLEPASVDWAEAWIVTERLIAEMNRQVRAAEADFLLVTLSTDIQAHPVAEQRAARLKRIGASDFEYFERRMLKLAIAEQFPMLALGPVFAADAQLTGRYLHGFSNHALGVGHWNEDGHALASRVIEQAVRQRIATAPPAK